MDTVETDAEIAHEIGEQNWYIPGKLLSVYAHINVHANYEQEQIHTHTQIFR
jgi:hypothetical protein